MLYSSSQMQEVHKIRCKIGGKLRKVLEVFGGKTGFPCFFSYGPKLRKREFGKCI